MIQQKKRNVFLYWIGKEYKLNNILRNLIYLHSTNGIGYNVILITHENIHDYIDYIPNYFYNLYPSHQADYVRVNVINDYGGIWIDSDTLVLDSLDSLFDIIENKDGFLVKENNRTLCNGIFGSKKNTSFMKEWKNKVRITLDTKKNNIIWSEIGSIMIKSIADSNPSLLENYKIFQGLDNLYPINWNNCVTEFITKPYDNYKNIIREYQPLIILVNAVYINLENKTEYEILNGNMPINYFINKSFDNMKLVNYNFIEIGTSNFETLIEKATNDTIGISVEAVKYYINQLPEKKKVKKINMGISNKNTILDVYYIPEQVIDENNLPKWFKGCNCIGKYHPLHIKHEVTHLCKIEPVKVIPCYELFYKNKVKNVNCLKIDTEGHDCIILTSLYYYIYYLPSIFYPKKIIFETNENTKKKDVDEVIQLFCNLGYKLQSRSYDTILVY
tara:strand:- start:2100 stop:3434 length:1335 start_codon:yes stop_codon:yes gene_type:complete